MLNWDDPVGFLKGATPSVRKAWEALGIQTMGDLMLTLPRRYDDYSTIVSIRDAMDGAVVTVRGKIVKCNKLPSFRKRFQMIRAVVADATGSIGATFFNQPWLLEELKPDREVTFSGKITIHPRYGKSMANPIWESAEHETVATGKIAPVYGLSGTLVQKTYRRLMQAAIKEIAWPPDPLEQDRRERLKLLPWAEAVQKIHEPKQADDSEQGRERLAFDELLTYRLTLGQARVEADEAGAPMIPFDERFAKRFAASLPFPLTADQKRAVWAAMQEMEKDRPMRRLLQGDVGSGKTAVAAFLAAHTQRAGSSAVMLAPTDILARQHAATFRRLFASHQIPLILVTRTDKRWMYGDEEKTLNNQDLETEIRKGHAVLVGTHALLEARRLPPDLAFAVVDEQHRFGVEQREALIVSARQDGRVPHFLSMTATPIPRSLALTLYGNLDVSILHEKPAGRLPIKTTVCVEDREPAYQAIREAVKRGEQAFVVCPLIDPSDTLGVRSATEEFTRLKAGPFLGLNVGLLHGRMKPIEKDATMQAFAAGELSVLVSTAVIEVGVDVPNATVIAIEGAERFGLAQLHQFRGRVGRSSKSSRCFLLTDAQGESLNRLRLLERTDDGFALAEEDLKLRGSGHLTGTTQSGKETFQAARMTDLRLMAAAREMAEEMLKESPTLEKFAEWKKRVEALRATAHLE